MDFVPDYVLAKKKVHCDMFSNYSSAYVSTNENLRQTMRFMPKNCDNALVVAASGDHPLFCSLYGAQHVDTFDISYNAKCIMDIKIAALKCLTYNEYKQFLKDLSYNDNLCVVDVNNMDKILCKLPKIEYDYIYALKDCPIFLHTSRLIYLPTIFEYYKLHKNITNTYNFILTDILDLGKSLTKSYDFMHLSNVFDYVRTGDYENIVLSLMKHVNPGGKIITQFFIEGNDQIFGFYMAKIADNYKNWAWHKNGTDFITQNTVLKNGIYVIERVR